MTAFNHPAGASAPARSAVVRSQRGDEPASYAVTVAVSDATDTAVCDLEPLQHVVDVDALNALFEQQAAGWLTFRYAGCNVTVSADGPTVATPVRDADG